MLYKREGDSLTRATSLSAKRIYEKERFSDSFFGKKRRKAFFVYFWGWSFIRMRLDLVKPAITAIVVSKAIVVVKGISGIVWSVENFCTR